MWTFRRGSFSAPPPPNSEDHIADGGAGCHIYLPDLLMSWIGMSDYDSMRRVNKDSFIVTSKVNVFEYVLL